MSPELEQAIRERVDLGHSKEQISEELRGAGYDDATIDQVYTAVSGVAIGQETVSPTVVQQPGGALVGFADMVQTGFAIAASQWKAFVLTFLGVILLTVVFSLSFGLIATVVGMIPGVAGVIVGIVAVAAALVFYFGYLMVLLGGLLRAVIYRDQGEKLGVHIAWMRERFWSAMLPPLYTQLITMNAVYVMLAYAIIVALATMSSWDSLTAMAMSGANPLESMSGSMAVLGILGLVAIVATYAVFLYLTVKVGWAMMLFVTDRARGVATLTESSVLVQGRFWPVFWRMLGLGVLFLVALLILDAVLSGALDLSRDTADLFSALLQLIAFPIFVSVGVCLFESLSATALPVPEEEKQTTHKRMKIGLWTGGVALVFYVVAIAVVVGAVMAAMMGGLGASMSGFDALPTSTFDASGDTQLSPAEQAELESFLQQFEAELESF